MPCTVQDSSEDHIKLHNPEPSYSYRGVFLFELTHSAIPFQSQIEDVVVRIVIHMSYSVGSVEPTHESTSHKTMDELIKRLSITSQTYSLVSVAVVMWIKQPIELNVLHTPIATNGVIWKALDWSPNFLVLQLTGSSN